MFEYVRMTHKPRRTEEWPTQHIDAVRVRVSCIFIYIDDCGDDDDDDDRHVAQALDERTASYAN